MSRKMVCLVFGVVLLLCAGALIFLVLLVRHEPDWYRRAHIPAGKERQEFSMRFVNKAGNLRTNIDYERKLDAQFTEEEINSFLADDYASPHNVEKNFPAGIREPRVSFDDSRFRFGFRYGEGFWSTIVSLDLKVWLAASEPNVVALQLESLKAGSLPITAQSMLDRFSETLRQREIEVTWYRHEGKPVALLRFQPGRKLPTVLLRSVQLERGRLHIGVGSVGSTDEPPPRASLTPESVKPVAFEPSTMR
jgi:hypothetical protein